MIEIMGPSAVGKSTVLKRIADASFRRADWLAPWDLDGLLSSARERMPAKERTALAVDSYMPRDFIRLCFSILSASEMLPSQKFGAAVLLRKTCEDAFLLSNSDLQLPVVHDEMLLHRAFSFLPHASDPKRHAAAYFGLVPVPAMACVFRAPADIIVARAMARGKLPNCYSGLGVDGISEVVENALIVCDVAVDVLAARGVEMRVVEAGQEVDDAQGALEAIIDEHVGGADAENR